MEESKNSPSEVKLEDFFSKVLAAIGKTTDVQIASLLKQGKKTLAVAESLTGGLISARMTKGKGSSDYFMGGVVCYNPRIKVEAVGVPASLIAKHSAVSKEVAIAMAEGIRQRFKTDIGLSATGAAGPDPMPPAPVGQVFVAVASAKGTEFKELRLEGERAEIRDKTTQAALGLLWLHIGGENVLHQI